MQLRHDIGPRRPKPFPSNGREKPLLLICPICTQKGLLYWFAPEERGYVTQCIKCGQVAALKSKDQTFSEIAHKGGWVPNAPRTASGAVDLTKRYRFHREVHDLGWQKAYRRGLIPQTVA